MSEKAQDRPEWINRLFVRQVTNEDLPLMEWDGEYKHFRRVYSEAFKRACNGLSILWVAEVKEFGLIGQAFVQLECDRVELADGRNRAYVYGFRVRNRFQNFGVGGMILATIENDLYERKFTILTLNVAKENERAQLFYRRHGFYIVAHEPGEWSYPDENGTWQYVVEPAWRMEKKLN